MIKHIVREWNSATLLYTCACGYQSKENIKPHSLDEVTCLDCLRISVRRLGAEKRELMAMGSRIANYRGIKEAHK
jgi:hypothetical protein